MRLGPLLALSLLVVAANAAAECVPSSDGKPCPGARRRDTAVDQSRAAAVPSGPQDRANDDLGGFSAGTMAARLSGIALQRRDSNRGDILDRLSGTRERLNRFGFPDWGPQDDGDEGEESPYDP